MDSLIFTGPILAGKRVALSKYGVAVTRRLDGLNKINRLPDKWHWEGEIVRATGEVIFYNDETNTELFIKSKYHVGQVVYLREAFYAWNDENQEANIRYKADWTVSPTLFKWRSPYAMSEKLARQFVQFADVRPERLDLAKISQHEIELEGGEPALKFLKNYHGLWCFRNEFKDIES